MTDYFPFQPSSQAPFQFQPSLDGNPYTGIVTWSLFGQRWYLNLFNGAGDRIFTQAIPGSPAGKVIQSLVWDLRGIVTVTTTAAHGYRIGRTLDLTISGCIPATYNGLRRCLITGLFTMTFNLSADPGQPSSLGLIGYDIDMLKPYGFTSTMLFRQASQNFEID